MWYWYELVALYLVMQAIMYGIKFYVLDGTDPLIFIIKKWQ